MENETHRFRVHIRQQDVDRFKQVIGRNADPDPEPASSVPLTFPAAWYGLPEVQSLIRKTISVSVDPGQFELLHIEQSIEVHAPMQIGATYDLCVQAGELGADNKLRVSAQVRNAQGLPLASMTSLFARVNTLGEHP